MFSASAVAVCPICRETESKEAGLVDEHEVSPTLDFAYRTDLQ